ncbi:MAG: hypothetical protein JNM78_19050 [Cyclobacteriaceae bacterium]|nr:hypothetical protein [Cyclobacteriaceae bacterium]
MRLKPVYRIVIFIGLSLLIAFVAKAQPGDPSADPDVPISGIEVLIALGGFLGVKSLYSKLRNKKQ